MAKTNVFFLAKKDKLIDQLKEYDRLYYNEGTSPVDDEEYDLLKDEAKKMSPSNPYFKEVGAKVESKKVKLQYVLGSLNKVKIDTVQAWLDKIDCDEFVVSEKLDGASIELDYENGELVRAMTRGDGFVGQDITLKAKVFANYTKAKGSVKVRAEAMLINNTHEQLGFKTARNGVIGILNKEDTERCRWIIPFVYELLNDDILPEQADELNKMGFLSANFPHAPVHFLYNKKVHTVRDLIYFLEKNKENSSYDIDGLVMTPINYVRENVELPKNKVSFKVNEKPVETKVQKVEWRVGRTGRVIPLVWVEPIEIQGVTIQKATGFNYKFIVDHKLGKGSTVSIVRSGDVIPYIVNVENEGTGPRIPHNCPSCGEGLSPIGVDLVCKNPECGSKTDKRIEHFLVRMGAENITRKTFKKIGVKSIEDLYTLDELEISTYDGFGVKRGEQICREIDKTLTTTPEKFISALGIPLIGRSVSKLVVDYLKPQCENEDHLMERVFMIHPDELMKIDGIGEAIAHSWFKNIRRYGESLLSYLESHGLRWESQTASSITGLIFTLTGKGNMSRNAIQTMIVSNGGIVKGISKKTNMLVTNNVDSTSTKAKKARQYGVDIISYEQLMEMLKG